MNKPYLHIHASLFLVLFVGLAGAAMVMLPLLMHPLTTVIVMTVIALVEIEMWGALGLLGIKFNMVCPSQLVSEIN